MRHADIYIKKTFCGFPWVVSNQYQAGGFMICVCILWREHVQTKKDSVARLQLALRKRTSRAREPIKVEWNLPNIACLRMTQSQVELHRLLMGQTGPPKITCVRYFRNLENNWVVWESDWRTIPSFREHSGSVVKWLTLDQEAAGSSLTGVTALWSSGRPVPVSLKDCWWDIKNQIKQNNPLFR